MGLQNGELGPAGDLQVLIERLRLQWTGDPQNGKYAQVLTLAYIQLKRYPLAETVIARYKSECGPTGLTHGLESELHFQQRQYEAAYREARESVKISSQNPRMHEILGLILMARRDYLNALPELQIAALQAPGSAQIRYFMGGTCIRPVTILKPPGSSSLA